MKTLSYITLIASTLLASTVGIISADTTSASTTVPLTTTAGGTQIVTLPGFDTSLGNLQSVTLTFNLTTSATPSVYASEAGDVGSATTGSTVSVTGPNGVSPLFSYTFSSTQTITTTGPGATHGTTETVTPLSPPSAVLTTGLASFTVPILSFNISDSANQIVYSPTFTEPGGFSAGGGSSSYGGTLNITYNYAATPEPSTWALMLGGLAVMLWRVRRLRA